MTSTKRAYFQSRRKAAAGFSSIFIGTLLLTVGTGTFAGASAKVANPVPYEGNLDCDDIGYAYELKIDSQPTEQTYEVGDPGVVTQGSVPAGTTITISNMESPGGRLEFDWASNQAWGALLVKQGNGGLRYDYDPAATNDQNVQTVSGATQGGISHITFCGPGPTTTTVPTTEPPTTEPPTTEPPTTEPPTTEPPTTEPPTTEPPTTEPPTTEPPTTEPPTTEPPTTEPPTTEPPTTEPPTTTETVLDTVLTQPTNPSTSTSATVAGAQLSRSLPRTGVSALPWSQSAIVLIGIGLALLGAARMRAEKA